MKLSDLDLYDPACYEMYLHEKGEWFYYEDVNMVVEELERDLTAARASMKYYREEIGALTEELDALRKGLRIAIEYIDVDNLTTQTVYKELHALIEKEEK